MALVFGTARAAAGCAALAPLPQPPAQALRVTDFGARPDDGVADDAAIERALQALRPGDWLVFPPGRYLQAGSVFVRVPGVTLWGRGAELHATDPGEQTLGVRASGVRLIGFTLSAVTDRRRTTPESARISVAPAAERGPRLQGVLIRDNRITAAGSAGIFITGTSDFSVAANTVSGTRADGVHLTGGARRGRVVGNQVDGTGDDGIAIVSYQDDAGVAGDITIEDNRLRNLRWGRGIAVVGAEGVTVRGNRIDGVARAAGVLVAREDGWRTAGVRRVLVEDNEVRAVQWPQAVTGHGAIELHALGRDGGPGIEDVVVRGNRIEQVGTDGIRIGADSAAGAVRGVRIGDNPVQRQRGDAVAVLLPSALVTGSSARGEGAELDCAALP